MTKATFGERLRIERERLGLTQDQFGKLGGMSRLAQFKYEHDQHSPSWEYLERLFDAKVDAIFLLTGRRLTRGQVDWDVLREAFIFVVRNFVGKEGKNYTPDQLFVLFRDLSLKMMGETYSVPVLEAEPKKKTTKANTQTEIEKG